jgi:outer membrane scaffolding protein for murein synthesis (MipA/OmpV family)
LSRISLLAAAAAVTFIAVPAAAQDTRQDAAARDLAADFDGDSVTVGVAGVYIPDYEGSNDYRFTGAPAAIGSVSGYAFQVLGNRASIDLIRNKPGARWDVQAGPIGVLNFNRQTLSQIDDLRVRALGKVGTAIELGGYVGIGRNGVITSPYDKLSVSVSWRHDVNGAHSSDIWQPVVSYYTPLSVKAAVGVFASAEHAGQGYATRYYSITPTQSLASGLPVYNARSGWSNWNLGVAGMYSVTGNLLHGVKVIGGVNYSRMLNDFGDSPVVGIAGSRSQWLGALGVAYTF